MTEWEVVKKNSSVTFTLFLPHEFIEISNLLKYKFSLLFKGGTEVIEEILNTTISNPGDYI